MAARQPEILGTIVASYRDVARAVREMPLKFVIALIVALIAVFVPRWDEGEPTLAGIVLQLAQAAVLSLLYTPFLIALHRYIILGEITRGYVIDLRNPRFMAFFVYSVLFAAVLQAPSLLGLVAPKMVGLAVWLFVLAWCLRYLLIFPAIAVDAPGVTPENALADARGNVWRMFWIVVLVGLPVDAVVFLLIMTDPGWGTAQYQMSTFMQVLTSVVSPLLQALLVAAASHLYLRLADRLRI